MTMRTVSLWVVLADQVSKYVIVQFLHLDQSVTFIKNFLYITYVLNPGAAFGFMADSKAVIRIPFFVAITMGAGLIVYAIQRFIPRERAWMRFALGLIWGGAMGNFIDRIFHGKVVDFINVQIVYSYHQLFPFISVQDMSRYHSFLTFMNVQAMYQSRQLFPWVFNIADSCITVGLIILLGNWFSKYNKSAEEF